MIKLENVSFKYKDSMNLSGVEDINLEINKGEVVVICGESGCGKTTIIRILNALIPQYYEGDLTGIVKVDNEVISNKDLSELASKIGTVFQNPKSQFFTLDTESEISFECENLGYSKDNILRRLEWVLKEFNIEKLRNKSLFDMSGGEKQKVACASVSAVFPQLILLDEPSSNLDIESIYQLKSIISRWKEEGKTVVISEHRLHYLMDVADKVIYMKRGKIQMNLSIDEFKKISCDKIKKLGLRALDIDEVKLQNNKVNDIKEKILIKKLYFKYRNSNKPSLDIENLELPNESIIAIIGKNGAGKSTFSRCLCGLEKKAKGNVVFRGKSYNNKQMLKNSYMVFQDVNHQLFSESVYDELLIGNEDIGEREINTMLDKMDLIHKKDMHPMSLSGGEKQRLVIGSAILSNKEIIIFDEPTSGLDYKHMLQVSKSLKELRKMGKAIFLISHDKELIYETCDYMLFIENGKVLWSRPMDSKGVELIEGFFSETN